MGSNTDNPVHLLMILDGWGINPETLGNAFALAHTPFLDSLFESFPNSGSGKIKGSRNGRGDWGQRSH